MNIVRLALLMLTATEVQLLETWTYESGLNGVDYWVNMFESCYGQRQSPINVDTRQVFLDRSLTDFTFSNFHMVRGVTMIMANDGHRVKVMYENGDLTLHSPGLAGDSLYRVADLHFHWGSTDDVGSEHTIDGKAFPMEMHVVSWKSSYLSPDKAVAHPDGLAVLGFLFEIQGSDNPSLTPIISELASIRFPDDDKDIQAFPLMNIIPNTSKYYRYEDGLTTPPCSEVVQWTVFIDTIKISQNQMIAFRNLKSTGRYFKGISKPLVDNFRPVQPINNRKIRANFRPVGFNVRSSKVPSPFIFSMFFDDMMF